MRSDTPAPLPVGIVGGGFSGTMTAAQLSARGIPSLLVDGSGRLARGVAYSTTEPTHILNVSTDKMTAWPDRPRDFADWIGDDGTGFVPRREFGRYLGEQLEGADKAETAHANAIGAHRTAEGWRLTFADGTERDVSALVLATGNQEPAPFAGTEGLSRARFVNNPWGPEARAAVARLGEEGGDVLVLGTGLTMIDLVQSLVAAGHEGRITAVSRRGLVPRAHVSPPYTPAPVELAEVPLGNVLSLWRWLRARAAAVGFRAAVDSLRPHSRAIWQSWPANERRRFTVHARPWWDVHRHRIAPQVAAQLRAWIESGKLTVVAGRVTEWREDGDALHAAIARRDGTATTRTVAAAFNCTGPLSDIRRTRDPLLAALLADGTVTPGENGLGLAVDEADRAAPGLWALGPLTKGRYWEIIAVPDIRGQAERVAAQIAQELAPHG